MNGADTSAPTGATIIDLASFRARRAGPPKPAAEAADPRPTDLRPTDLRLGDRILCHETQAIGTVTAVKPAARAGGRTEITIQFASRRRRCFADEIEGWRDHGAAAAQDGARRAAADKIADRSPGQLALFAAPATSSPAAQPGQAWP